MKRLFLLPVFTILLIGLHSCESTNNEKNLLSNEDTSNQSTVIIECSPEQLLEYDDAVNYISNDLHNETAAQALRNIKQLFINNNFCISSPLEVEKYNHYLRVYANFIASQPDSVVDRLSAME